MKDKMKSMKRNKSNEDIDIRESLYPYGLSISLDKESIDKLGLKVLPDIGETLMLCAKVDVVEMSETQGKDEVYRSMTLQITDMMLHKEDTEMKDVFYGDK